MPRFFPHRPRGGFPSARTPYVPIHDPSEIPYRVLSDPPGSGSKHVTVPNGRCRFAELRLRFLDFLCDDGELEGFVPLHKTPVVWSGEEFLRKRTRIRSEVRYISEEGHDASGDPLEPWLVAWCVQRSLIEPQGLRITTITRFGFGDDGCLQGFIGYRRRLDRYQIFRTGILRRALETLASLVHTYARCINIGNGQRLCRSLSVGLCFCLPLPSSQRIS